MRLENVSFDSFHVEILRAYRTLDARCIVNVMNPLVHFQVPRQREAFVTDIANRWTMLSEVMCLEIFLCGDFGLAKFARRCRLMNTPDVLFETELLRELLEAELATIQFDRGSMKPHVPLEHCLVDEASTA